MTEKPHGMAALSDREIDDWLLFMEELFGKEFLTGEADESMPAREVAERGQ